MKKSKYIIFIIILTIAVRIITYSICGPDYETFLKNWYSDIINNGGFKSLGLQIGNYAPPYILLLTIGTYITSNALLCIKFISLIFDIVLAIYSVKIISHFIKIEKVRIFAYILLIPGVIINSAVLGQCDSIYTSFVVMFIYYILKDKKRLALFLLGIALSFKLQAIFIFPILLYLLITKKIKIRHLIYIILGYILLMIPAMCYGKGISDIIKIYIQQTKEYPRFVSSSPNIYSFLKLNYQPILSIVKYAITLIVIMLSCLIAMLKCKKNKYNEKEFLVRIMLLSILVPFLLPSMHDRCFYMANILIFIIYYIYRNNDIKKYNKLLICSCIAYFIPVFTINFLSFNVNLFQISEILFISFISCIINIYVIYIVLNEFVLNKKEIKR